MAERVLDERSYGLPRGARWLPGVVAAECAVSGCSAESGLVSSIFFFYSFPRRPDTLYISITWHMIGAFLTQNRRRNENQRSSEEKCFRMGNVNTYQYVSTCKSLTICLFSFTFVLPCLA